MHTEMSYLRVIIVEIVLALAGGFDVHDPCVL
jgi:hypothetical protein